MHECNTPNFHKIDSPTPELLLIFMEQTGYELDVV